MKPFSRVLFLFCIVFAASFSACSDNTSNVSREVKQLQKAAEQGDPQAQCNLGRCYIEGDGVEKDEKEAAEQGVAKAQFNLGVCYERGKGVEQDSSEAVKWYRKAAEQNFELAMIALERLEE